MTPQAPPQLGEHRPAANCANVQSFMKEMMCVTAIRALVSSCLNYSNYSSGNMPVDASGLQPRGSNSGGAGIEDTESSP